MLCTQWHKNFATTSRHRRLHDNATNKIFSYCWQSRLPRMHLTVQMHILHVQNVYWMINYSLNPSDSKGNYSATSNNTKLVHWPLMLHLVQQGWAWGAVACPGPSLGVVTCALRHEIYLVKTRAWTAEQWKLHDLMCIWLDIMKVRDEHRDGRHSS